MADRRTDAKTLEDPVRRLALSFETRWKKTRLNAMHCIKTEKSIYFTYPYKVRYKMKLPKIELNGLTATVPIVQGAMDAMVAYSTLMFALSGTEVCANFVTSIDRPQKTIPRAIFTAAAIIAGLYIFGSIAITMSACAIKERSLIIRSATFIC